MSNSTQAGSGIGLGGALLVLFVALKLTHYIDWSWWWVLSPLWIWIPILVFIFGLIFIGCIIKAVLGK